MSQIDLRKTMKILGVFLSMMMVMIPGASATSLLHFHHEEEMFIETTGVKSVLSFHKDYTRRDEVMVATVGCTYTITQQCSTDVRQKAYRLTLSLSLSRRSLFNLNCVFSWDKGNDVE